MKGRSVERLRRLDGLLEQTLAAPRDERDALLLRLESEDPTLAVELKQLIVAAERNDPLLDGTPWARLEPALGNAHVPGETIGPYRLAHLLGSGGMGDVWLAHNAAQVAVALKLIRSHLSHAVLGERLKRERDILMRLRHRNIAHLLDSGLSDAGEPYLIIEYVDGEPLLLAAEAAQLNVRGRVGWMLQIAHAVAAAQAQLIVHRDIKPANILIDRDGQPKLLDFGIAKLLDDSGNGSHTELTHAAGQAFTPAYAAPEQLRGEPVSTATDVYALGVVLHELLLGCRPERDGEGWVLPSRWAARAESTSVRQRARDLRGDLDSVLLRALAPTPAARYANAQAFGEELSAWLDGQPVRVREGAWYRLGKLVVRNRVASIAIAAGLAVSAIGAIGTWQQSLAARREAERAAYVQAFLEEIFSNDLPGLPRDELPSTAELMARGTEHALADTSAEPGARLSLLLSLARIQIGQRLWSHAEASFEAARALLPEVADAPAWQAAAIDAELAIVQTQVAPGQRALGVEALEIAIYAARARGAPDDWFYGKLTALIAAKVDTDDGAAARRHAEELLSLLVRAPPEAQIEISALTQAAVAYSYDQIYRPEAENYARRALEKSAEQYGEEHAETAYAAMRVAGVLRIKGDIAGALPFAERAGAVARRAYPAEHPQLARILEELARIRARANPNADATPLWREILVIREKAYGTDSYPVARTRTFLAASLNRQRQYEAGAQEALAAAAQLERELGKANPVYLDAVSYAVSALTELDRKAEALRLLPSNDSEPPPNMTATTRWRFLELLVFRLRLQPDAAALQRLVEKIAAESDAPRDIASLCLTVAALGLEQRQLTAARNALAAADQRIAVDDSTKLSEIATLLRLLLDKADPDQIQKARDIVAARRGERHYAIRLADAASSDRQ